MHIREWLKAKSSYSFPPLVVVLLIVPACTSGLTPTAQSRCPKGQPISEDLHKKVAALGPFVMDKRQSFHTALNDVASRLWQSPSIIELKRQKVRRFPQFPLLILLDRDEDGRADEFAYETDKGPPSLCSLRSPEFGFIFDLNEDGRFDYIVFNGGPVPTKKTTFNREELKAVLEDWYDGSQSSGFIMWENYHWIDSNGDAIIDIAVWNAVDLNQNQFPDEGVTAWVYDTNFDGVFDRGEYLAKDFQKDMEREDGVLILQRWNGQIVRFESGHIPYAGVDKMFSDVNSFSR